MENVSKQFENVDRRMEKFEDGAQSREVRIAVLESNMSEIKLTLGDISTTMKTFMTAMDQKYATVIAFHELRQDIEKQLTAIQRDIEGRASSKLKSTVSTVLLTTTINALIGYVFWTLRR